MTKDQQEYAHVKRDLLSRRSQDALSLNNRGLTAELERQQRLTNRLVTLGNKIIAAGDKIPTA